MRIRTEDPSFKTLDLQTTEKELNDKERSITHFITKKVVDRDGDIVDPNGIDESNFRKNPTVLFSHDRTLPIGKNAWLKSKEDGKLAKTIFAPTLFADDIYQLHKGGFLNAWSMGFIPKSWEWDEPSEILTYTLVELLEYSSVTVPANQDALDEAKALCKSTTAKEIFDKSKVDIMYEIKELKRDLNAIIQVISTTKSTDSPSLEAGIIEIKALLASIAKKDNADQFRGLNENITKTLGHILKANDTAEALRDSIKEIKEIALVEVKKTRDLSLTVDGFKPEIDKISQTQAEIKDAIENKDAEWQVKVDTALLEIKNAVAGVRQVAESKENLDAEKRLETAMAEIKNILLIANKRETELQKNIDKIFSKITEQQFRIDELISNKDNLESQERVETQLLELKNQLSMIINKSREALVNKKTLETLRKNIVDGEVSRFTGK